MFLSPSWHNSSQHIWHLSNKVWRLFRTFALHGDQHHHQTQVMEDDAQSCFNVSPRLIAAAASRFIHQVTSENPEGLQRNLFSQLEQNFNLMIAHHTSSSHIFVWLLPLSSETFLIFNYNEHTSLLIGKSELQLKVHSSQQENNEGSVQKTFYIKI